MFETKSHSKGVADLLTEVRPLLGAWDELRAGGERISPAWTSFLDAIGVLSPQELSARWDEARRLLRENGVSHNVYADPRGGDRPWQLDALPQVLSEEEWEPLANGIRQRARLVEAFLQDLYGPRQLVKLGLLPEELVHSNPGYLRPLAGTGARHPMLHTYGCDLARGPDGTWRILADRTQSPAGLGYMLENRIVLSRTFPEAHRTCQVLRLAPAIEDFRLYLARTCGRENPRAVLLSPGPFSETYFEHAFLARHLGYTLVESGDLTVREDRVWLKTLEGLRPVDLVLRRIDDEHCDPLELRSDTTLGIPGLAHAVRAGNVLVTNALGSGAAESAALQTRLAGLTQFLLGEDPLLESVPGQWCGDPTALEETLSNLGDVVVKPSFPGLRAEPVFGSGLGEQGRQIISDKIRRNPGMWCSQRLLPLSSTIEWSPTGPRPRCMSLRVFALRSVSGWNVVPGGLVRTSSEPGKASATTGMPGGTKDLWVLSGSEDSARSTATLVRRTEGFQRGGTDIPSRVADNLFWMGRYAERAEGISRLSRAALARLSGESGPADQREVSVLMTLLRSLGLLAPAPPTGRVGIEGAEHEIIGSVMLASRAEGLQQTLNSLHQAGFQVRDRISNDTWRVLNLLRRELSTPRRSSTAGEVVSLLDRILLHLAALSGMTAENTTRGLGWRFLDAGHRLERGRFAAELALAALAAPAGPRPALDGVLETADASITYRSRYTSSPELPQVLDLLLADETNPRSLRFQLHILREHLSDLPALSDDPHPRADQRIVERTLAGLFQLEWNELVRDTSGPAVDQFVKFVEGVLDDLPRISEAMTGAWLSHSQTTTALERA
jgi:uncharacterized circularly permuted ATP-grasp superfamily protein/uncharacterized alpha-E superfamily protein